MLRGRSLDEYLRAAVRRRPRRGVGGASDPQLVQDATAQRVADARAETHPDDAVPYVQAAVERTLRTADWQAYREAAKLLVRLRELERRAGRPERFDGFLAQTVESNRRRPTFLEELRRHRLHPGCLG